MAGGDLHINFNAANYGIIARASDSFMGNVAPKEHTIDASSVAKDDMKVKRTVGSETVFLTPQGAILFDQYSAEKNSHGKAYDAPEVKTDAYSWSIRQEEGLTGGNSNLPVYVPQK